MAIKKVVAIVLSLLFIFPLNVFLASANEKDIKTYNIQYDDEKQQIFER